MSTMEDYPDIGGSAFNSLASLTANPLGSTDTLLKYFSEQINPDTIFEDLEMISPTELSYVTFDNSVKFMGTFDENFGVLFDGKEITLNEAVRWLRTHLTLGTLSPQVKAAFRPRRLYPRSAQWSEAHPRHALSSIRNDYIKNYSGEYIITTSGKRFAVSDVTTFTDTGLGYNSLVVKEIYYLTRKRTGWHIEGKHKIAVFVVIRAGGGLLLHAVLAAAGKRHKQ